MDPVITAEKIHKWRIAKSLTRGALAAKVGRTSITVWKWEKGGVCPSTEMLGVICDALGIGFVEFIVTGVENIPRPSAGVND